jgi:succinate-semialdehyde dehydrogenase/glutarate-semialdehyde dehydrogenase
LSIATINPATNELLKEFEPLADEQLNEKLDIAIKAFHLHRRSLFADRAAKMLRAAQILETEKEHFGRIMTIEMGKTLKSAMEEAAKCAWACRYYAEEAARLLADEVVATSAKQSYIHYQPIGVVLAVMPWNFPFWQVFRFAAPALMAGNVGLLKHSSNVPQCALAIEEIFLRAGFSPGIFQTLLIGAEKVQQLIDDPRVMAVTLTGSEPAGSKVASAAGKEIKKTVLELGGSDPFIVMPSANLAETAQVATRARCINNGQSCIAAKRFIAHEKIYQQFQDLLARNMAALIVGDPMQEQTDIGPLATPQIVADIDDQVRKTVAAGARIVTGGQRLDVPGNFYAPTVLADIPKDSPGYREEFFGPVALLFRAQDIDEAIAIANDSPFGLGASAWTNNEKERSRFIDELDAGQVFINGMVVSDPRLPFGGVKRSGYGRELSVYGIREFVNIKTVWIKDEADKNLPDTE